MRFTAELTNPKPPGLIHTSGKFGPWNMDAPSESAVDGHYDFQNADLSVFNGISGTLSSVGDFTGTLVSITVDGTTDTPNFKLDSGSRSVHLTTNFHAVVNGTNGNTYLQPVNAHFLGSNVVARGEVSSEPGERGKTISLDVNVNDARVQDLLELAVTSAQPVLAGKITTNAKLRIPPGRRKVLQRLQLAGNFEILEARFASEKVKDAIVGLSRRAQGKPNDLTIQDVPAELAGAFVMRDSTLTFSPLQFDIPGVVAQVKGTYGLNSEALNFSGDVRMQAHVSNTMTGVKRILLKPVDPMFARHNAGTYLPVNVTGEREHPQIKLDIKKVL
jgi:hypothetical protein